MDHGRTSGKYTFNVLEDPRVPGKEIDANALIASRNDEIFLADSMAGESNKNLRTMWSLFNGDAILDAFADKVFIVSDLKIYRLLVGLSGGLSKYSCILDKELFTINKAEIAKGMDKWDSAPLRGDSEAWREHLENKKYNVVDPPVSYMILVKFFSHFYIKVLTFAKSNYKLIDNLDRIMVPPPFHGFEGVTNKIVSTMKDDSTLESIMQTWFDNAKPNPLNYRGGSLNGNDCSKMMKHFTFMKNEKNAKIWYFYYSKTYSIIFEKIKFVFLKYFTIF